MSNVIRSLVVRVGADTKEFSTAMKNVSKDLTNTGKSINKTGQSMSRAGTTMTRNVTLPVVALGTASAKAAIDFESAFAGVRKTVDASEADFGKLERGIRDMSKEIPASAVAIAGVAEAAGQLGIEVPNIMAFTRTMIDLGEATNLSAEEAATQLARFANITGMSQKDFSRLGSTIVELGNNLATTEAEIVAMGMRLAGAGSQIGLTEAQTMSFAAALSSVGIEAEAGGSAFSKVMVDMSLAAETGGGKLQEYGKIAGMTGDQFAKAFKEDAAGAITAFVKGLSETESAIKVLDDMGIKEVRMRDALLRAAGASDIFSESLDMGSQAWAENIALTKEADQRYGTTASQLSIARNRMMDAAITAGEALAPHIIKVAEAISNLTDKFNKLSPEQQEMILKMALAAAAIGPVLKVTGSLTSGLGGLFTTAGKVTGAVGKFSKALTAGKTIIGALGLALGPGGLVLAGLAAFAGAAYLIYKNWDKITAAISAAIKKFKEFTNMRNTKGLEGDLTSGGSRSAVQWNAKGAIFTRPTVLPTIAGWQGFGEAGPEAVLPLSKLNGMLSERSQTVNHTGTIRVEGVSNRGELVAVTDLLMSDLARAERRNR